MTKSHTPVRACLITNPKSGRGGIDLTDVLPVLSEQGWELVVRRKEHGVHATELARDAARDGFDVVVDCAGDGTLSEIVSGVVGTGVAVGTIPGGTVNLWSKEVGISPRLRVAAMQLVNAERRRLDVGHVTVNGKHGTHFLLMAGAGVDAAIVRRVNKRLKNRIGPLASGLAAIRAIPDFHALPVEVELDGGVRWEGRVSQVIVGNTRRYAGFTRITDRALADDGLLDICLITATNPLSASRQLASLLLRQRPSDASAEYYRSATMTLRAPRLLPLQIDGGRVKLDDEDPAGEAVYTFTLQAQAVSMLVPRTYNGELFQPEFWSDTHARPALAPAPLDGQNGHNGHAQGQKRRMRLVSIGADTLTAAKLKNGKVVNVQVDRDTLLRDRDGAEHPLRESLSALAVGDVIAVKGKKSRHAIHARRVTLLDPREA